MKVLLITSKFSKASVRWMPLGVCYLAAALRNRGHEVRIFDRFAIADSKEESAMDISMRELIRSMKPDWIGINAVSPYIFDTVELVKKIRKDYEGRIVLGGHHPTAMPELTLARMPEIDAVICGEGERSLGCLVEGKAYEEISGLAWMDTEGFHQNPPDKIESLDELPMPAFDLLEAAFYTKRNARTIHEFYRSVGTMMISRGCKNRCSFCTETLTYAKGVRYHSSEYVLNWMEALLDMGKMDAITFLDSDFLADRKRIEEVCEGIILRGYHRRMIFCIQTRASHLDEEILSSLYQAGCRKIELGIETIKKDCLKSIAKNETLEGMERAIRLCAEVGIRVQANLIYGMEGETIDDLLETIEWVKHLPVDNLSWGPLMLLPGSRLYREKGNRFFETREWTEENIQGFYYADHLSNTSKEELEEIFAPALRQYRKRTHHQNFIRNNRLQDIWAYYRNRLKARWLQVLARK